MPVIYCFFLCNKCIEEEETCIDYILGSNEGEKEDISRVCFNTNSAAELASNNNNNHL